MQAFEYARPATLRAALGLLSSQWGETEVLAGGTDLLGLMKDYVATPKRVVDIKGIRELGGIRSTPAGLRLGALVTVEELLRHRELGEQFPAVAEAAAGITSPQMRNMGTVGGDLCQRPRCWYFRNGFGLFARDPQGHEFVPRGDNRYHAIFANSGPAYFVCPSSLAPPLIALDAKARLAGPKGEREMALADFFVLPRSEAEREHALAPEEILTEVILPAEARALRSATYEVRQRQLMDWPLVTASVALKPAGGTVAEARIVMGHVAAIPWRATEAEKSLMGKPVSEATAAEAAEVAVQGARPLSRNRHRVQLARVAVKRALLACVQSRAAAKGAA